MNDTAGTPEATAAAPGATADEAGAAPAAPEQIQVAPEALARWAELDPDALLKLTLTRSDFDHLMLGLRTLAISQSQLVAALTGHINQDMESSARALLTADQLCVAAYNRINAFITVLMLGATPEGGEAPKPEA